MAKSVPNHKWDGDNRQWVYYPTKMAAESLIALIESGQVYADPATKLELGKALVAVPATAPVTTASQNILTFKDGKFVLKTAFSFKDQAKSIPTRRWDTEGKAWTYLPVADAATGLLAFVSDGSIVTTDDVKAVLNGVLESQDRFDAGKTAVASIKQNGVADVDVPLKAKLFDHQKKAFAIATSLDSAALLMEQGTGKTFAAIATAGKRFQDGEVKKLLVVCPSSIMHVWRAEFQKFADFPTDVKLVVGSSKKRVEILKNWQATPGTLDVAIINYESVWRVQEAVVGWAPDMVICDESQKLKNKDAKQTKGMFAIGDRVKYKLILTGTPVTQSPMDFFGQYRFLDSRVFGKNFYKFRDAYAIMGGYMHKVIEGYRNVDDLTDKAHSIAYRVTKADALDLPAEMDQMVYACLEPEARTHYRAMEKEMKTVIADKKADAQIILTQLLRLQQITGGFLKMTDGTFGLASKAKLNALSDLLESYPQGKKIVIFANFHAEIDAIEQTVRESGRVVEKYTGETTVDERARMVEDFQGKATPEVLVIQSQTGGRGITLTAADTIIFYSLNYSLENYDQTKARIHRIGQTMPVTYVHILAKDTIDEGVLSALRKKRNVADLVVDLKNNFSDGENPFEYEAEYDEREDDDF
jgi:SNF2 family DNA or RNA helicase